MFNRAIIRSLIFQLMQRSLERCSAFRWKNIGNTTGNLNLSFLQMKNRKFFLWIWSFTSYSSGAVTANSKINKTMFTKLLSYRAGRTFSQLAWTLCIKLNIFIFQNHAGINNYFYFNINISTCFEYMCFLYLSYFSHLFTGYSASKNTIDINKKKHHIPSLYAYLCTVRKAYGSNPYSEFFFFFFVFY